jgi:hypothetical protein
VDIDDFELITSSKWITEMVVPEGTPLIPSNPPLEERALMPFLLPIYRKYLQDGGPLLALKRMDNGGASVIADQDIPRGAIVTEYLGLYAPQSTDRSKYRFGPIDGLKYRNYGAMVDDGFPNLCAFYLYNIDNLPIRIVFIAVEEIAKGDLLSLNYGMSHSVKMGERREDRLQQMITFFNENPFKDVVSKLTFLHKKRVRGIEWNEHLEYENLVTKIQYLFHTPQALAELLTREVIQVQDARDFYLKGSNRYELLAVPQVPNARQKGVIDTITTLININS